MGDCGQDLNMLRALRNELFSKTVTGRQYTAFYYQHAVEMSAIFAHNAQLKEQARMLMRGILPAIESILAKRKTAISEDTIQKAIALIDALRAQASPALQQDLTLLKQDIEHGIIFKTLGVMVQRD
jgi:predicted glutamine amidotransferase